MGMEGHETTVVCSTIALLQERFRQLEKVKEMREEKQLMRMLSEVPNKNNDNNDKQCFNNNIILEPAMNCEPSRLFFHPDLIFPRRSSSTSQQQSVSLTLWPTFQSGFEDQRYCLWRSDSANSASKYLGFGDHISHEITDVDTSLRL